ncbi:MAG: hypothetical protein HOD92_09300 [Deltaproteobacteria bacterium]|jgi:tetratricopeptide (TPR) repeat protein|nr:hypothetical protein [Deltaproteobacteria bacterium]
MKILVIIGILISLVSGCITETSKITFLSPAVVDFGKERTLVVLNFKNDEIGLTEKVRGILGNKKYNDKVYFKVIDLDNLDEAARTELNSMSASGSSQGVALKSNNFKYIVAGKLISKGSSDSSHREERDDDDEIPYVKCKDRSFFMETSIKIIDYSAGKTLFSDVISRKQSFTKCEDHTGRDIDSSKESTFDKILSFVGIEPEEKSKLENTEYAEVENIRGIMPSKAEGIQGLATKVAKQFVSLLIPKESSEDITILSSIEGLEEIEESHQVLFDRGVLFLEKDRADRAGMIFEKLNSRMKKKKSYSVLYNLGVVYESLGDYATAKSYYKEADLLTLEPIDEITAALVRIKKRKTIK